MCWFFDGDERREGEGEKRKQFLFTYLGQCHSGIIEAEIARDPYPSKET